MSDDHTKAVTVIERGNASPMSPVVAAGMQILERNPNPETLRELLAVQKEWEANESRKAFAQALVDLKRDLPSVIRKDQVVDFTSSKGRTFYRHASLANVLDQIEDPLQRHGFTLSWETNNSARDVTVTCRLLHCAGHTESTTLTAPIDTGGGKNPIQSIGSTQSYLQRYTAIALLGLATADMPDADTRPAPEPDAVVASRNREVATKIVNMGKALKEAEDHVGKPTAEWTTADIDELRRWVKPPPKQTSEWDGVGPDPWREDNEEP